MGVILSEAKDLLLDPGAMCCRKNSRCFAALSMTHEMAASALAAATFRMHPPTAATNQVGNEGKIFRYMA
jgi:hypothetical protein